MEPPTWPWRDPYTGRVLLGRAYHIAGAPHILPACAISTLNVVHALLSVFPAWEHAEQGRHIPETMEATNTTTLRAVAAQHAHCGEILAEFADMIAGNDDINGMFTLGELDSLVVFLLVFVETMAYTLQVAAPQQATEIRNACDHLMRQHLVDVSRAVWRALARGVGDVELFALAQRVQALNTVERAGARSDARPRRTFRRR